MIGNSFQLLNGKGHDIGAVFRTEIWGFAAQATSTPHFYALVITKMLEFAEYTSTPLPDVIRVENFSVILGITEEQPNGDDFAVALKIDVDEAAFRKLQLNRFLDRLRDLLLHRQPDLLQHVDDDQSGLKNAWALFDEDGVPNDEFEQHHLTQITTGLRDAVMAKYGVNPDNDFQSFIIKAAARTNYTVNDPNFRRKTHLLDRLVAWITAGGVCPLVTNKNNPTDAFKSAFLRHLVRAAERNNANLPPELIQMMHRIADDLHSHGLDMDDFVGALRNPDFIGVYQNDVIRPAIISFRRELMEFYCIEEIQSAHVRYRAAQATSLVPELYQMASEVVEMFELQLVPNGRYTCRLYAPPDVAMLDEMRPKDIITPADTRDTLPRPVVALDGLQIRFYNLQENQVPFQLLNFPATFLHFETMSMVGIAPKDYRIEHPYMDPFFTESSEEFRAAMQQLTGLVFPLNRSWEGLYFVELEKIREIDDLPFRLVTSYLIWRKAAGYAIAEGRPDRVSEAEYLWAHVGHGEWNEGTVIGNALGLSANRRITMEDSAIYQQTVVRDGLRYDVLKLPQMREPGPPYPLTLPVEDENAVIDHVEADTNYYVAVNIPWIDYSIMGMHRGMGGLAEEQLYLMHQIGIIYYRRVDFALNVVKTDNKNRPKPVIGEAHALVAPQAAFHLQHNLIHLHRKVPDDTAVDRKWLRQIKNKGSRLATNPNDRVDLAPVMAAALGHSENRYSATAFARNTFADAEAQAVWRKLRHAPFRGLRTDQEWCHLHGHGDGGDERYGNAVAGSEHCNTEQLAIEMGQRTVTQKRTDRTFLLRSTAYLYHRNPAFQAVDEVAPEALEPGWVSLTEALNQGPGPAQLDMRVVEAFTAGFPPLAAFIRYKIIETQGGQQLKRMDHTFDAQSEFFDINQYRILNFVTRFLLEGLDAFHEWLSEATEKLLQQQQF